MKVGLANPQRVTHAGASLSGIRPAIRLAMAGRPLVYNLGGIVLLLAAFSLVPALLGSLSVASSRTITLPFLALDGPPIMVVFAGFAGCSGICPTGLADISRAHESLTPTLRDQVGVTFVDVQTSAAPAVSLAYAKTFNPAFGAYAVRPEEAATFKDALALDTYADASAAEAHPGHLYLLVRHDDGWRVGRFYRRLPEASTLQRELTETAEQLG